MNTGVVVQQDARGIHEDVTDPSVRMIASGLMWQLKMLVNDMLSPSILVNNNILVNINEFLRKNKVIFFFWMQNASVITDKYSIFIVF